MYNYQQEKTQQRTIGITFVVVFHVFLVWALLSGLARDVVKVVSHKVEVKLLEDPPPPPPPPPPPKPKPPEVVKKIEIPKVEEYVPPPEITPPAVSENAISAIKSEPVAPPPIPPKASGKINASGACSVTPPPDYPRKALQEEVSGIVLARFRVNAGGGFAEILDMSFGSIPGDLRSQFRSEIVKALRGYQCDKNLEDAVLEKEFAFKLE
jgi:protein TonB